MTNLFSLPIGLRGVSTVWHGDMKIGICLSSAYPPLIGDCVPLKHFSVMDNTGENPLPDEELKTMTEIRTDVFEISPEEAHCYLGDTEGKNLLGERVISLFYLSHINDFLVTGISYQMLPPEKIS